MAQILLEQPDILLLDEPTNHLDLAAIEWLEDYLHNFKGTVLIVSYDCDFLNSVVNKILEIENGEIWVSKGNYDQYVRNKEEKIAQQFAEYQEQPKKKPKNQRIKLAVWWEPVPPYRKLRAEFLSNRSFSYLFSLFKSPNFIYLTV
ncbi:MAG: hypothetical protein ABS939_01725 [Psychrobacillus sp.]